MGSFQIGINRRKMAKKTAFEVFDVVYNYGTPAAYTRKFTKSLNLTTVILKRSPVVKSDGFHPTSYGATNVIINAPMGFYSGSRNGGYTPSEPFNYENPTVLDLLGYSTGVANPNTASKVVWSDNDMNNVTTRSLAKFGADEFHTGIFLAESVETANYFADKAKSLFKMVSAVKRGNIAALRKAFGNLKGKKITARNTSKVLAERWLEYKYAVMPVFNDTIALANMFHNGIDHNRRDELRPWELITSAVLRKDDYKAGTGSGYQYKAWHKLSYYCKLWAVVDDAELYAKSKFGISSLAEPLWELIPFSFVWDWMMPIGTFLQALTATSGLKFSRGFTRFRADSKGIVETRLNTGTAKRNGGKHFTFNTLAFSRRALSGFPTALPYVKSPFSTDHTITALALFRVLFINDKR